MLITMLGAFAQAESESISANVRWGKRQAMREGKAIIQYSHLYAYEKGEDGNPKIIPEQAEVVRSIYDQYLTGASLRMIKDRLEQEHIPNIRGDTSWTFTAIRSILTNEKYCGDVLLQKTYTSDCISRKVIRNTGQLPMYLVQNHHEGIVSRRLSMRCKPRWRGAVPERAPQRSQHQRVRLPTPANMRSLSGSSAASAVRFTGAAHGRRTAESALCGAVSAAWTTAQNTAMTRPRWTKNRCKKQFLRPSTAR